jgi:hypothetical protein
MAQKPKARRDKSKDRGEEKTQGERFIEAARAHGVDETGNEFERALRKIAPPRTAKRAAR